MLFREPVGFNFNLALFCFIKMLKELSLSIKSYGLVSLMVAPLLPAFMAKQAVVLCFFLIVLVNANELFRLKYRIHASLILLFFFPGILVSLQVNPSQLIRLAPIIFLTLLVPLRRSMGPPSLIFKVSVFLILYCIIWQIGILLGVPGLMEFRNFLYPYREAIHPFNCNPIDPKFCISSTLLFPFGQYRAAGIFFNPNLLSFVLVILYATVYGAWMSQKNFSGVRSMHRFILRCWPLTFLVLFSQYLTGSRTGFITFFVFHLCSFLPYLLFGIQSFKFSPRSFSASKVASIFVLSLAAGLFATTFKYIRNGFSAGDSLDQKLQIFLNYYARLSAQDVMFGSGLDVHFDSELGFFFGFGGVAALLALILFYCLLLRDNILLFPLVIVLLLTSVSNSVMYSLMTSVLLIPAFIAPSLAPSCRHELVI